jgi:hypothetical protein
MLKNAFDYNPRMSVAADVFLTFHDVAERKQFEDARIYPSIPYWNRPELEGASVGFYHLCEWFEVNVHEEKALNPEAF